MGTKPKDLSGQRFGQLVAIKDSGKRIGTNVIWTCQCDCGKIVEVRADLLRQGRVKSCGCTNGVNKIKDIQGERFGSLVAIRPTNMRTGTSVIWECRCDCGNITYVSGQALRTGKIKSCGCSHKIRKDLSGQKFGMLTVIRPTDERRGGYVVWECRCDCGTVIFASTHNLTSGNIKSCGCMSSKVSGI